MSTIFVTYAPGRPDELFVVEQRGRIYVLNLQTGGFSLFLNIESLVDDGGSEQGLLGLAFHPNFTNNGFFYVNYTFDPGPGNDLTRIDRFHAPDPLGLQPALDTSRTPVLAFEQDFSNHNGGWLGFSPTDGYLYIATGDGGSGNDPQDRGQTLTTRLGKILRIDVDGDDFPSNADENYRVPPDNPGIGLTNMLPEIWAYGLRNPWRSSFDRSTGRTVIFGLAMLARAHAKRSIFKLPKQQTWPTTVGAYVRAILPLLAL